jgi:hypothetical protein
VRKHGSGGLQRNEDGDCGLQKIEVHELKNNQSIKMLTAHMKTISHHQKRLAVVDGRPRVGLKVA